MDGTKILFFGNSGVGKSSLLNSIFRKQVFVSGFKIGQCIAEWREHGGVLYGDTPGLSGVNMNMRRQAASEISTALREGGEYKKTYSRPDLASKLIFVGVLDSGRVRADDLATMKLVLDATGDDTFPFAIVVNKAKRKEIDIVMNDQ